MEKGHTISQKPNEEKISRKRSTKTNDSEKHSKMRTKKKYVNFSQLEISC